MPKIIILDADGNEVDSSIKAVIGGKITWTIKGVGGKATEGRWSVNGVTPVVGGYTQSGSSATLQPAVQTAGSSVTWYWAKTGTIEVTAKAVVEGHTCQRNVTVTVVAPQIISFDAKTDEVKVAKCTIPGTGGTALSLTFGGDTVTQKPGIKWTAKVIGPQYSTGEFAFTQLMKIHRRRRTTEGKWETNTSNGAYVLDEVEHYPFEEGGEDEKETASCMEQEMLKLVSEDSPASALYRSLGNRSEVYDKVEVDDAFRTYLMFRPKGGIWVAVALLEWSWSGEAEYDTETSTWILGTNDHSASPSGSAQVAFPLWTNNRDRIM